MKMQFLFCMLITVMMLCGCTAAASDAGPEGTGPGFPASGSPAMSSEPMDTEPVDAAPTDTEPADTAQVNDAPASAAQVGKNVERIDYGVGDGPAAPEETQYGRALYGEEAQALWARLEGKWILSDPQAWQQSDGFGYPVYDFSSSENGGCRLREYSAWGSGVYEWKFSSVREQNGVYTIRAVSESSSPTCYECHQDSGTRFTLQFTENGMLLARSRPAQFRQWETGGDESIVMTWLATEAEQALLAREADEYGCLMLEEGCELVAGYDQPAQAYRFVTDEELEQLLQEAGE